MAFQVSVPGPYTYLVHEHARSIVAIQELQEEVTSLLEFRENVLAALPHLHSRPCPSSLPPHDDPQPARPAHRVHASPSKAAPHVTEGGTGRGGAVGSSSGGGGKSLSETHSSAVADSGFSTDKAGGSMGKSSSSSAGEHLSSGGEDARWTSVEPDLPLGSAEDELWHLLDVIQRKGTRLRSDLERAEQVERDHLVHPGPGPPPSPASDPLASQHPHPVYRDAWPHSLPGPLGYYPSRTPLLPPPPPPPALGLGLEAEAWAAVERLRQDRQYLAGRVSWAEAEAAASHQRLLDLHTQLLALAGDKRRLEDQVRALCLHPGPLSHPLSHPLSDHTDLNLQFMKSGAGRGDGGGAGGIVHSVMGGVNTVHIVTDHNTPTTPTLPTHSRSRRPAPTVTVSVGGEGPGDDSQNLRGGVRAGRSASSVRLNSDRDRDREVILPRVLKVPIKDRTQRTKDRDHSEPTKDQSEPAKDRTEPSKEQNERGSDRVVIERERRAGRADGGWSMPVSLLKGGTKLKVPPNKQRISAILREKDVIELQRQLLTTVMETEVLRKQVEAAGAEWESRSGEWESQHRTAQATITVLREQNTALRAQVEGSGASNQRRRESQREVGVSAGVIVSSVGTMTEGAVVVGNGGEEEEEATHRVHPGPNIKYDVVVHEDPTPPRHQDTPVTRKVGVSGVEKPPRRTRESPRTSTLPSHRDSPTPENGNGRDSLGRSVGSSRPRPGLSHSGRGTPTGTPRSSPAPSMTTRLCGARGTQQEGARSTPINRSSSTSGSRSTQQDGARSSSTGGPGRSMLGRRDSLKAAQASGGATRPATKTSGHNKAGVGGVVDCPPPSSSSSSSSSSPSSSSSSSSSSSAVTVAERGPGHSTGGLRVLRAGPVTRVLSASGRGQ